ncbi:MAG: glucose-6-phosphate isomerase [Rhodobacteraceae bacterium]|nr:MAG: glucose-6-phosphate isomerase [Paracoccaceae bacterium]
MRKIVPATFLAAALALGGCQMTDTERSVVGGVTGAAGGLAVANLLGANTNWRILGTVAGAAAGTLLAQNTTTGKCAYARGDGTYYEAPCP